MHGPHETFIFAGIVLVAIGRQQRAAVEHGAVETARALTNATDESLNSSVKLLEALATSRSLDHGDLRAFHAEARRAVAANPDWLNVVLFSLDDQQIVKPVAPGEFIAIVASLASRGS